MSARPDSNLTPLEAPIFIAYCTVSSGAMAREVVGIDKEGWFIADLICASKLSEWNPIRMRFKTLGQVAQVPDRETAEAFVKEFDYRAAESIQRVEDARRLIKRHDEELRAFGLTLLESVPRVLTDDTPPPTDAGDDNEETPCSST